MNHFTAGWLHLKLVEKANEEKLATTYDKSDPTGGKTGVGAAIQRL